jgi:NADH-quinone oxidoreductase subunit F
VFAGGDVVTGPNTVVDAIAAGRKAARMIARSLRGEEMKPSEPLRVPRVYVAPCGISEEEAGELRRAEPPTLPIELRKRSFSEVELTLLEEDAQCEARRCLRCDLEFTQPAASEPDLVTAGVKTV